jgi:hypothetical protein
VESCYNISLISTVIASIVGLAIGLRQRTGTGGLFGRTIGIGAAVGLGFLFLSMLTVSPDGVIMALGMSIPVTMLAVGGGTLLAVLGIGVRSIVSPRSKQDHSGQGKQCESGGKPKDPVETANDPKAK